MINKLTIIGLAILFAGCRSEQSSEKNLPQPELTRSMLIDAKSLSFEGNDLVTDGGSIVYIFRTDKDERLKVFLKVQFDENYNHLDVTNSTQPIQICLEKCMWNDMYTIEQNSKEEKHLLLLISHSTGEEYDPVYSKIRTNLTSIIKMRNFPWSTMKSNNKAIDARD
jgi:hypothetical protein